LSQVQALLQRLLCFSAAGPKTLLQDLHARRLDEEVNRIQIGLLHAEHSLDVDVEGADATGHHDVRDGPFARAVYIARELGVLQELFGGYCREHLVAADKVVVFAVDFSGPRLACGVRDTEGEQARVLGHEAVEQGAFAAATWPTEADWSQQVIVHFVH